jgi:hypothetical protein
MNAPLIDDDERARMDAELDGIQAERRYRIERYDRLQDFAPVGLAPRALPDEGAETPAHGRARVSCHCARAATLLRRLMRHQRPQRGRIPAVPSSPDAAPVEQAGAAEGPLRIVGVCGSCMGPVLLDTDGMHAACPCGDTLIPRKFFATALKEAPRAGHDSRGA